MEKVVVIVKNNLAEFWNEQLANNQGFNDFHLSIIKDQFKVVGKLKVILGFEFYAVSDDGKVFTCRPCSHKQKELVRELKQSTGQAGHKFVHFSLNGKSTLRQVHRLVAMEFLPPPKPGQKVVRHLDGNPANNDVSNLAWGTQKDNMQDCIRHGNTLKGTKSANAKLNEKRVRLIRCLAEEGFSIGCIAEFFGVSQETVRLVVIRESWRHVD